MLRTRRPTISLLHNKRYCVSMALEMIDSHMFAFDGTFSRSVCAELWAAAANTVVVAVALQKKISSLSFELKSFSSCMCNVYPISLSHTQLFYFLIKIFLTNHIRNEAQKRKEKITFLTNKHSEEEEKSTEIHKRPREKYLLQLPSDESERKMWHLACSPQAIVRSPTYRSPSFRISIFKNEINTQREIV